MTGWPEGVGRLVIDEVDSTNAEAARRATSTEGPLWIAARRQTAGRGRSGRSWSSPEGNLAATLLLRSGIDPAARARLSFHAALAVAETLDRLAPGAAVSLKWPNDVLLNDAKVSGILLESYGNPGQGADLAIGIGVNLAHHPPPEETRWRPISVAAVTGRAPDAQEALTILASQMAVWLELDRTQGFAPIRASWLARASRLGQPIVARLPSGTLSGIFEDVDATGALVLNTGTARRVVSAADIHFPD